MIFPYSFCCKSDYHCGASENNPFFRKGIRNPCCFSHLFDCLDFTCDLLNHFGVRYWLDCATLLGKYRHGGILPWDLDIDFTLFEEDLVLFLNKSDYISKMGFWFCFRNIEDPVNTIRTNPKEFTGRLAVFKIQTSFLNKTHVDLYSCSLKDDFIIRGSSTWPAPFFPYNLVEDLDIVEFHGRLLNIPKKTENYIKFLYGDGWEKIPPNRIEDMSYFKQNFQKYKKVMRLNENQYRFW